MKMSSIRMLCIFSAAVPVLAHCAENRTNKPIMIIDISNAPTATVTQPSAGKYLLLDESALRASRKIVPGQGIFVSLSVFGDVLRQEGLKSRVLSDQYGLDVVIDPAVGESVVQSAVAFLSNGENVNFSARVKNHLFVRDLLRDSSLSSASELNAQACTYTFDQKKGKIKFFVPCKK